MRLAIILLMCGAAWGQQVIPEKGTAPAGSGWKTVIYKDADGNQMISENGASFHRVCRKYQHLDPANLYKCVDDTRMVTEREWHEMLMRLKKAEAYRKAGLESSHIAEQCLHDLSVCTDRIDAARMKVQQEINEIKALEGKK